MNEFHLLLALVVGAFIPAVLTRLKIRVPILHPSEPTPTTLAGSVSETRYVPIERRPLAECFDWIVRAGAGLIPVSETDLRTARAMRPHLDSLLGAAVPTEPTEAK